MAPSWWLHVETWPHGRPQTSSCQSQIFLTSLVRAWSKKEGSVVLFKIRISRQPEYSLILDAMLTGNSCHFYQWRSLVTFTSKRCCFGICPSLTCRRHWFCSSLYDCRPGLRKQVAPFIRIPVWICGMSVWFFYLIQAITLRRISFFLSSKRGYALCLALI